MLSLQSLDAEARRLRAHGLAFTEQPAGASPRGRWGGDGSLATSRRFDGRDRPAHHAMVLTLGPLVAEAGLLKGAACGAVEERGRNLLALRVLWVALHHATARLRDQIEGTTKRHSGDAFPSIVPVDEETRDAIVGRLPRAGRLLFLPVCYPRKRLRRTV